MSHLPDGEALNGMKEKVFTSKRLHKNPGTGMIIVLPQNKRSMYFSMAGLLYLQIKLTVSFSSHWTVFKYDFGFLGTMRTTVLKTIHIVEDNPICLKPGLLEKQN